MGLWEIQEIGGLACFQRNHTLVRFARRRIDSHGFKESKPRCCFFETKRGDGLVSKKPQLRENTNLSLINRLLGSLSKKAKTGINQENGRHAFFPLKKRRRNDSTREIIENLSYFYFKLKGFKNEIANKKSSIETLSFLRSLSFSINESMATTLVFPFEITILLKKKERILFFSKVAALAFKESRPFLLYWLSCKFPPSCFLK